MLASILFAPAEGLAAEARDPRVGLSFADSIPAHERAHLNDVFPAKLRAICDPVPCFEDCRDDVPTVGLELGGHSRDYELRWSSTAADEDEPRRFNSSCELCSLVDLEEQIAEDLSWVCGELSVGRLTLSSEPKRARVSVDGRRVGRTPWTKELPTGPHTIELGTVGRAPTSTTVAIAGGQTQRLHLELVRSRRPSWPAWTTLGFGVALSLAGTVLIAVDGKPWTGRCAGNDVDVEGDCRFLLSTRPLGLGLALAGVGALSSAAGLFVWVKKDGSQRAAGVNFRARF